ncbi:Peptidase S8 propeptide/proteinase inhibitor I9 [Dillenia turbinata]|uniref:Peptidase S8 propeptide/proteinase inhibitor I9 n=1 Tax=Dillenia turbinata TaxID=194707 RepID=A0AAN8VI63_9MAGN
MVLPQLYIQIVGNLMASKYFVFMNFDPEYERLRADGTKQGSDEVDLYLSKKHDELLATTLEPGTYKKALSLVIVDGFAVEITDDQANALRSAKGVRVVEKNQELA